MAKKITKKDMFNIIKSAYPKSEPNYDEVIAFINHEIELLEKKNSADKKPTAQQVANEGIKNAIYDNMENGKLYTIDEITKSIPECADLTNQKISALLRQMILDNRVERIEEKRKAYFRKI